VARDAGFFEKHGLRVEVLYVGSSTIALSAFLAGEIDILVGGGTVGPTAYLRGLRDIALFGALENRFPFKFYSVPSITQVSQLRGKRIGVTRFGGTTDFASRYFLKTAGFDPRKDFRWIQVGTPADILMGLKAGSIDAGLLGFPTNISAQKQGYREIADLTQSGVRYSSSAFLAKRHLLSDQRPRIEGFLKALIEAIHYAKTDRKGALKVLSRYMRMADVETLGVSIDEYADKVWTGVPELQPDDIKLILEHLGETDARALQINPSDLIDTSILSQLLKDAFVDRLYGRPTKK
jgi:NitT/TauT family transport system substrate-binding protein